MCVCVWDGPIGGKRGGEGAEEKGDDVTPPTAADVSVTSTCRQQPGKRIEGRGEGFAERGTRVVELSN